MKKHRALIHILLALACAGLAANQPLPVAAPQACFGGLLRLRLPLEWQVAETDSQTIVVRSADEGPSVEISSWEMPRGGDPSARAAAAAHETMLFERMPYRRDSSQPLKARSGEEGLLVIGRVLDDEGHTCRTAFAAFAAGARYWIAGTFYADEASDSAPPSLVREIAANLEFAGPTAPEGPAIAQLPAPGSEVAVTVAPTAPPEGPAISRPAVAPQPAPVQPPEGPAISRPAIGPERITPQPTPLQPPGEAALPQPIAVQPQPVPAAVEPTQAQPPVVTSGGPHVQPAPGTLTPRPAAPFQPQAELPRPQFQPAQPTSIPGTSPAAPVQAPREALAPQSAPLQSQPKPALIQPQPVPALSPEALTPETPAAPRPAVGPKPGPTQPVERPSEGPAISRPAVGPSAGPTAIPPVVGPDNTRPLQPPPVRDVVRVGARHEAGMVRHDSPLGFSLEHPADWTVQLLEGHVEVVAPLGEGSATPAAAVIIWPVSQLTMGQDPAELARALLAESELVGAEAAILRARTGDEVAIVSGKIGGLRAPRQVVACCYVQRDQGLLTALVARPEEFQERLPALLHVLQTFSGGPWWADTDAVIAKTTIWQEPPADTGQGQREGWLRLPVPEGWQISGQVKLVGDMPVIGIEMHRGNRGELRCLWRQPLLPMFRDLTPVLRNLGWQEGDRYPANLKENQLRVAARLSPQDYLTRRWLAEGPSRLENVVIDRLTATQAVAALTGRQNSAGVIAMLHGDGPDGARQRVCLLATGEAAPGGEPNCWQAAVLEAEAPAGAVAEAMAVLHSAIDGAMIAEGTPAPVASRLREEIAAARVAVAAHAGPAQARVKRADVLAVRNTQARGRLWLLAPEALEPWHGAVRTRAQGQPLHEIMPELTIDYWK